MRTLISAAGALLLAGCTTANEPPGGPAMPLISASGQTIGTVRAWQTTGGVTFRIEAAGLPHGVHGLHVHEIGKCEPNSVAPTGGAPGNFLSAGGHYQAPGHTGKPESGDLASLQVRQDGSAYLVTTTDSFNRDDLLAGNKTALMLHGAQDTENAMDRIACGVIGTG